MESTMNWKELLRQEVEFNYSITQNMIDLVDDSQLEWKPSTGENWMTTGQLLMHLAISCGAPMMGYVTGDWGIPEGVDIKDLFPDEMLPTAEQLPTVGSVAEAKSNLEEDKQIALDMLEQCSDDELDNKMVNAPWDKEKTVLGRQLLYMIAHLTHHKGQLFYYLKLQGKPVNTGHLCGEL
jgi:DinB family protein